MIAVTYLDATVIGQPLPQTRPRVFKRGGTATDTPKLARWKATVVAAFVEAGWTPPAAGQPLHLELQFVMPVEDKRRHGRPSITMPDVDNLAKAVGDTLMEAKGREFVSVVRQVRLSSYAGVIADDGAIATMTVSKVYGPHPGGMRVRLADAHLSNLFPRQVAKTPLDPRFAPCDTIAVSRGAGE